MNTAFAGYVIVAWVVLAVAAFPSFKPRRGMLVIMFSGCLFLPEAVREIVELGPIKFSKGQAICYAMLLATLLYDAERLFAVSFRLADAPALIWCICPVVTTLLNDLPPDGSSVIRDALSQLLNQTTIYLIPYLIGRAYFADADGLRELANSCVVAGLIYVPFCLFEARMSPQLHTMLYGYMQHDFLQQIRFGGYRPMVFMSHGLVVALFIATATVFAAWIRIGDTGAGRWPNLAVWVLGVTLVLCKSTGAIVLGAVGLGMYLLSRRSILRWALLILAAIAPAYCVARTTGLWSGAQLVDTAASNVDVERAESLNFRLVQENELISKALERPAFGWGGWGRNRVTNKVGRDQSVTDGMWVIFLGTSGIVGLTAFGAMVLLPIVRYSQTVSSTLMAKPQSMGSTGCAVVLCLWCVDSLFNAALLPPYLVMAAGLTGITMPRLERDRPSG